MWKEIYDSWLVSIPGMGNDPRIQQGQMMWGLASNSTCHVWGIYIYFKFYSGFSGRDRVPLMSLGSAKLLFVFIFAVNCVLWSQSRYGQFPQSSVLRGEYSLVKRISLEPTMSDAFDHPEKQVLLSHI